MSKDEYQDVHNFCFISRSYEGSKVSRTLWYIWVFSSKVCSV